MRHVTECTAATVFAWRVYYWIQWLKQHWGGYFCKALYVPSAEHYEVIEDVKPSYIYMVWKSDDSEIYIENFKYI